MSAFGPHIADVSQNPNINHDPAPPPLDHLLPAAAAPAPQVLLGGLPPTMGPPTMGMPFNPIFSAGPLDMLRIGYNIPQYGAGLGPGPGVGMGMGMGVGFPPFPPGIPAAGLAPFAAPAPMWDPVAVCGGPGVGMMMPGMMPGMIAGMGMGPYGFGGLNAPAPGLRQDAVGLGQPEQGDFTVVAGGVPPGVTHVESAEHTIVIVLRARYPPWLMHFQHMPTEHLHVGSSTGMNRLIQVCNENRDAEGMALTECIELGNGMWEKGQTFVFDEAMSRVLTIKDAGWDNKRNRVGGKSLHVHLHRV